MVLAALTDRASDVLSLSDFAVVDPRLGDLALRAHRNWQAPNLLDLAKAFKHHHVLFVDSCLFRYAANVYQISMRAMVYDKWWGGLQPPAALGEVVQLFWRGRYADLLG